jgi:hypothetical protein
MIVLSMQSFQIKRIRDNINLFLLFQYLDQSLYLLSLALSKFPLGTMAEPPTQLTLGKPENNHTRMSYYISLI